MREWFEAHLPADVDVLVDIEAIEAWLARNPGATIDEARQLVDAPDHLIELRAARRQGAGSPAGQRDRGSCRVERS